MTLEKGCVICSAVVEITPATYVSSPQWFERIDLFNANDHYDKANLLFFIDTRAMDALQDPMYVSHGLNICPVGPKCANMHHC